MKRYKKLQNIANESLVEFHNEEVKNELRSIIQDNRVKDNVGLKKQKRILIASLASVVVVMVAIVAIFAIFPFLDFDNETKVYNKVNQLSVESDLSSVNADLSYFALVLDSSATILRVIDNYYNETLYYNIKIVYDSGVMFEINVVTNKNYSFDFENGSDKTENIYNYALTYEEHYEALDEGIYLVKVLGSIDTDKEKIYISYNEVTFAEENNYIENIRQILKTK